MQPDQQTDQQTGWLWGVLEVLQPMQIDSRDLETSTCGAWELAPKKMPSWRPDLNTEAQQPQARDGLTQPACAAIDR
jgi:hypothetical protein